MEAEIVLFVSGLAILVGLWLAVDAWHDVRVAQHAARLKPFALIYFITQNALGVVQTLFFIVAVVVVFDYNVEVVLFLVAVPVVILAVQLYTFFFKRRELRRIQDEE